MFPLRADLLTLTLVAVGAAASTVVELQNHSQPAIDVLSYRISIEVGREASSFRARTDITFEVKRSGLDRVHFDLVGLSVDSVLAGLSPSAFRRDAGKLEVPLDRAADAGDTMKVAVYYHGAPDDGLVFRNNRYGEPAVFADNWPARARYWFPSVDHPSDKARVEFLVVTPPDWVVVANGRRIDERMIDDGSRRLTVWATDKPIPVYTMVVGAAELEVREVGAHCTDELDSCVEITQWSYPEDVGRAAGLFRRAPEMLAFFDSLIGPFPYEKLALVQSTTRYGGMENSSAIFFTERLGSGSRGDGLVAHEIAHQWFGDAVTEREWPHLWLSEGFATYFTSVFFEFADGDTAAARIRAGSEQRYISSNRDVPRPVIADEPDDLFGLLNANNYQKGAWVLHMLRLLVGDDAFFEAIRLYYSEFLHGTAMTSDLERIMEERSGEELSWFFQQWLWRPGYPQVDVRSEWSEGKRTLELHVLQSQPWPPFSFPLRIDVEGEGYKTSRTFWVEERESRHAWPLSGKPSAVIVDPDNALLGPTTLVRIADG
jgi:aminopeptidase N